LGAEDFGDAKEEVLRGEEAVGPDKSGDLGEEGEKSKEVDESRQAGEEPKTGGKVHKIRSAGLSMFIHSAESKNVPRGDRA